MASKVPPERFTYEPWRHGGWYVNEVRYPTGASGCVTRNMINPETGRADRKWRIACDPRNEDHSYASRDEAALAEWHLAQADSRGPNHYREQARKAAARRQAAAKALPMIRDRLLDEGPVYPGVTLGEVS